MTATLAFLRTYWHTFAAAVGGGAFMAAVGAFGTGSAPLLTRLVYWVPLIVLGTLAGIAHRPPRACAGPKIGENTVLVWAIVTALVTLPGTIIVWGYTALIFGSAPRSLLMLLLDVAIVSGGASAIMLLINRPGAVTRAAAPTPGGVARARALPRPPAAKS